MLHIQYGSLEKLVQNYYFSKEDQLICSKSPVTIQGDKFIQNEQ